MRFLVTVAKNDQQITSADCGCRPPASSVVFRLHHAGALGHVMVRRHYEARRVAS